MATPERDAATVDLPAGIMLEDRDCPMGCARNDERLFMARDQLHGLPGLFNVVRCRGCGLMRTNPRPTPECIGFYYPADYSPYETSRADVAPSNDVGAARRLVRSMVSGPSRAVPDIGPGRLLEIGCASGQFLLEMRNRGWHCDGIEFSEVAALRAAALGFRIHIGPVDGAPAPQVPYDLIVGWMVLEHLHEPIQTLKRLLEWTRPGGWIALSVPDLSALDFRVVGPDWYGLHIPNHLYHFTSRTATNLLRAAGWMPKRLLFHRNASTPLRSLAVLADRRGWSKLARRIRAIEHGERAAQLRTAFHLLSGWTRQSGRITLWAQRN